MSIKSSIKLSNIIKRSSSLNSLTESIDSERCFSNLENALNGETINSAVVQHNLRSYIESMCNVENATKYYYQPFNLMEKMNEVGDKNSATLLLREYTTRIIPYIKDLTSVVESVKRHANLTEDQVVSIYEAVDTNGAADRILANHERISKRFNIENEAKRYNSIGLKYLVDTCAEMVDTYSIANYQKFNITLEEVSYLLEKNGYKYDRKDLTKYCLEYYLVSNPYISDMDRENYKKVLSESIILSETDTAPFISMLDKRENDTTSIQKFVNSFLVSGNKDVNIIINNITTLLASVTKEDIMYNSDKIISLLWDLFRCDTWDDVNNDTNTLLSIKDLVVKIGTYISDYVKDHNFTKEDIITIIDSFEKLKSQIKLKSDCNNGYSTEAADFLKSLDECIAILKDTCNIIYYSSNICANDNDNQCVDLKSYMSRGFHNTCRITNTFDKFIAAKDKKANIYNCINPINMDNALDNPAPYINNDHKVDICVRQYLGDIDESYIANACTEYKNFLESQDIYNYIPYYVTLEGISEIRLLDNTTIELTTEEAAFVENSLEPAFDTYLNMIYESNAFADNCAQLDFIRLDEALSDFSHYGNFTLEHFEAALEAMSYLNIDNSVVKLFGERFNDYNFNKALESGLINESYATLARKESYVMESVENRKIELNVPPMIQLEAYDLLLSIMEDAGNTDVRRKSISSIYNMEDDIGSGKNKNRDDDDEDDEDDDDDEDEKPVSKPQNKEQKKADNDVNVTDGLENYKPKKGKIDLTSIKLALKGLTTKTKDFTTKQKEAVKNLDNAARAFIVSTRNTMSNERREALIKGSLVPSFSRCIKAGVVVAAIGYISPVVGIISAFGAIAVSKKLTDRERKLLLDEIETEVEVVEKELSIADSNGEMKKYRALLNYKKNLQRQYQRIRYNIRVGKDITPTASMGFPGAKD